MKVSNALKIFRDYQKSNLKQSTAIGYGYPIDNFEEFFGEAEIARIFYIFWK